MEQNKRKCFIIYLCLTHILLDNNIALGGRSKGDKSRRKDKTQHRNDILVRRLLSTYTKQNPPRSGGPTEVRLGIYVNSFYLISEQTMEFSANFYLRQSWADPRLAFQPFTGVDGKKVNKLKLEEGIWARIWVPDIFFSNEKKASYHDMTVANRLMRLNATGHLWYVIKISATLSCPMKLQKYPFDSQNCPMVIESFGHTMSTMYFAWLDDPVQISEDLQLPQFTLKKWKLNDCSQNSTMGAFPCLKIYFVFARDIGFLLIQLYFPTILVVLLSWLSFWLNTDAIPARVSLGLLTVLTMTTQSANANSSMPRVSYIKAIDIWMFTCLIFVFSALVEFSIVNVISRRGKARNKGKDCQRGSSAQQLDAAGCSVPIKRTVTEMRSRGKARSYFDGSDNARKIDKLSRICFPLAFLLFNSIYWTFYTHSV